MEIETDNGIFHFDRVPDTCPMCHHGIEPRTIGTNVVMRGITEGHILQILYRCPRKDCQSAFIATHWQEQSFRGRFENNFSLTSTMPFRPWEPDIPKEVKALSENFTEIYTQATNAEQYGLDQIAGVGYRKALEFLVKDYCISKFPAKEMEIKSKLLGTCVLEFVDDSNIKECARRAAWLGNDETHYVRKWENKDINDLKILIELTMAWIRTNVLTARYLSEMKNA